MADLKDAGTFPPELDRLATTLVHRMVGRGPGSPALDRAVKAFPAVLTANQGSVPTIFQMEQQFRPDPASGRKVFDSLCSTCHSIGGARQMGPDLSAIGTKLDRQALLDAIVVPSAAIAFGYESWALETTTQGTVTGLLVENTPERVTVKVDATQEVRLKPDAITARKQVPFSTMPEGLISAMTPQQIVDLIGFLTTLKAAGSAGSSR
jgi:putative heme-binding domain-containing protein